MERNLMIDENKVAIDNGKKRTVTDDLFDKHLGGRRLILGLLIFSTIVVISWFQLRVGIFGAYEGQIQRPVHLALFMFFIFMYSIFREKKITILVFLKSGLPAILSLVILYYYISNYYELMLRMGIAEPKDFFYGIVLILLVLEATRRTAGYAVVIVATAFILYSFIDVTNGDSRA